MSLNLNICNVFSFLLLSNLTRNVVEGLEKLIRAIAKFGDVTIKIAEMMALLQRVLESWFSEAACTIVGKPLNMVCIFYIL